MSTPFQIADHGMRVKVTDDGYDKHCLHLIMDVETGEFIVNELPTDDEVTKMIARGVCELALADCPTSRLLAGDKL